MWLFKKKVTKEEFLKFEKQVQESFCKAETRNQELNKQLGIITAVTYSLIPLLKQFTEHTLKAPQPICNDTVFFIF